MNKIVFDMDGTLADFYGVENWLEYLEAFNPYPYINAKPLVNTEALRELLLSLRQRNWIIEINSWLSKTATQEFNKVIREAKREWLAHYNIPYDEIHLIKYGTPKQKASKRVNGVRILFDDNANVRDSWSSPALNRFALPETEIIKTLSFLKKVVDK